MGRTLRVFGAAVTAAGALVAMAGSAAAEPSATIDDISLDGCDIVVTFTVGDAGQYDVEVWDDGEQIGDVPVTAAEGATVTGRYKITAVVKQGASGLGISVASPDGSETFDNVDPYNGADAVIDFCASQSTSTTEAPPAETPTTEAPPPDAPPPAPARPGRPTLTG